MSCADRSERVVVEGGCESVSVRTYTRTHTHHTQERQRPFIQITYQTDTNPGPVLALTDDGHRLACLAARENNQSCRGRVEYCSMDRAVYEDLLHVLVQ